MLQTVDVLIGFSMVMLVLSVVVTMLVQFVISTLQNLKGKVLKEGIAHLLNLLDKNNLTAAETMEIADHLLRDALVSRKRVFGGFLRWLSGARIGSRWKYGLAHTIHREELIKLIIEFAADGDIEHADEAVKSPDQNGAETPTKRDDDAPIAKPAETRSKSELRKEELRKKLKASLAANELKGDLGKVMVQIRGTILALETTHHELASDVRQTMAIAAHANSEFVAKINAWFDQTIDRTVESFTGKTRAWTTLFAAVVALFFQVDTFELLQRLSVDKQARQTLVGAAVEHPEQFGALVAARKLDEAKAAVAEAQTDAARAEAARALAALRSPPPATQEGGKPSPGDVIDAMRNDPDLGKLVRADLIAWPESATEWFRGWPREPYGWLAHLIGVLVTIGLLTLGAPVWYEILKNLIQFRSLVARKDDAQRAVRQTNQKPV